MGMFDEFESADRKLTVQLKVGPCLLETFRVNARVDIADGVYRGFEGAVVVRGKIVRSVTKEVPDVGLPYFDKWGFATTRDAQLEEAPGFKEIYAGIARKEGS